MCFSVGSALQTLTICACQSNGWNAWWQPPQDGGPEDDAACRAVCRWLNLCTQSSTRELHMCVCVSIYRLFRECPTMDELTASCLPSTYTDAADPGTPKRSRKKRVTRSKAFDDPRELYVPVRLLVLALETCVRSGTHSRSLSLYIALRTFALYHPVCTSLSLSLSLSLAPWAHGSHSLCLFL